MLERRVIVINALGLHARAAAQLVRLANGFKSSITITRTDTEATADAKDILHVLALAANLGVEIRIIADGEDEATAIEAIEKLFLNGFGEI